MFNRQLTAIDGEQRMAIYMAFNGVPDTQRKNFMDNYMAIICLTIYREFRVTT